MNFQQALNTISVTVFTLYSVYCIIIGVKSISMSSYGDDYIKGEKQDMKKGIGFYLFMFLIAFSFILGDPGRMIPIGQYEVGGFVVAGILLIVAGTTYNHQEKIMKPVHHVSSALAILVGYYALPTWPIALISFGASCLLLIPVRIWQQARFLLILEMIAFYVIKICMVLK